MGACAERSKDGKATKVSEGAYDNIKQWGSSKYDNYKEQQLEKAEA